MRLLTKLIHNDVKKLSGRAYKRRTARGIILDGSKILLMYTKSYNDYSFPGGGVNSKEDLISGLKRELKEETGAEDIDIIDEFGMIDEYRPSHNPEYDLIHMESYFFTCRIKGELGEPQLEDYEITHGMNAVWIDLEDAINHNKNVIKNKEESMGFSIKRETYVLELILTELINK